MRRFFLGVLPKATFMCQKRISGTLRNCSKTERSRQHNEDEGDQSADKSSTIGGNTRHARPSCSDRIARIIGRISQGSQWQYHHRYAPRLPRHNHHAASRIEPGWQLSLKCEMSLLSSNAFSVMATSTYAGCASAQVTLTN